METIVLCSIPFFVQEARHDLLRGRRYSIIKSLIISVFGKLELVTIVHALA